MEDLHVNANSPALDVPPPAGDATTSRVARAARSVAFLAFYFVYLIVVVGLGQRLVVWPLVTLLPGKRRSIVGWWLRAQARNTLALARWLANVRVSTRGAIVPGSCLVVMNHQSVLDIPISLHLTRGPQPVIITRDRYKFGLPGVSPLTRLGRFPFVHQGSKATREELAAIQEAAELVERGEQSLIVFPEGHRSRDGGIGRFMRSGLRLVLPRVKRPVFVVVADGMWRARTFADAAFRLADTRIAVVVLGPFPAPAEDDVEKFIDQLHEQMSTALADLRGERNRDTTSPPAARTSGAIVGTI